MKFFGTKSILRWWFAVLVALSLTSCGGNDDNSPVNNLNTFTAALSGAQETPPTPSAATGVASIVLNPVTRVLTAVVTTTGINGTAAHIHEGAAGAPGPILFPLAETAPGSGIWTTKVTLNDAQMTSITAGNYFVNVHSAAFPNGEIRGQIAVQPVPQGGTDSTNSTGSSGSGVTANMGNMFVSALTGNQATPSTTSTAFGAGAAIVDPVTRAFSAAIITSDIAGTAAHIREGAFGVSGSVIFPLAETSPGSGIWTTKTTLTDAQLTTLRANNYYFNVQDATFPNGAIRGQILGFSFTQGSAGGTTGTGTTGAGTTGAGTTGTGTTGAGTTGTGTTGIGTTGTGTTGTGTTGIGTTGTGTTGTGTTGIGTTGTGTTGAGTTGTGTTGTGTTGTGTTGIGTTGIGTTGTGTTGTGTTGIGTTGIGTTEMTGGGNAMSPGLLSTLTT